MKNVFDIRTIIAALFGIYGAVLTVMGVVTSTEEIERTEGFNVNLWSGICMLVFALLMAVWTIWRPIRPPEPSEQTDDQQT